MMYLSRGIPTPPHGDGVYRVSHCGRIYALGPESAALWQSGQFAPRPVLPGKDRMIARMEESGLVVTTEESGPLGAYRLLAACILCPNDKRQTDRFLTGVVRRMWIWLNDAGLRLTGCELIRLEERQVKPTPALLGELGRQRLTEMIYMTDTIPDGILETAMEHSPARDGTIAALLKLLRTGRLALI